jgi:hypothetical protein
MSSAKAGKLRILLKSNGFGAFSVQSQKRLQKFYSKNHVPPRHGLAPVKAFKTALS